MVEYANNHLNIFIQEKDLKESILKTIPVISSLQVLRRMDEFMAQLLNGRKSYFINKLFMRKSKEKTWMLWGPLCKLQNPDDGGARGGGA